jgi:actin-related protein
MGIPEAIINSIDSCSSGKFLWKNFLFYKFFNKFLEIQPHLYNNILLTGGNTMMPGFRERV